MTLQHKEQIEQSIAAVMVCAAGALFASPFLVLLTGLIAH